MIAGELVEAADVPEVFVSGLGRIDILHGGVARLLFFSERCSRDGVTLREVVLSIVIPIAAIPATVELSRSAIGGGLAEMVGKLVLN